MTKENLKEYIELLKHQISISTSKEQIKQFEELIKNVDGSNLNKLINQGLLSVQKFIDQGGDIDSQNEDGETMLMIATKRGLDSYRIIKFLIKNNANLYLQDNCGYTALELLAIPAISQHLDLDVDVELLIALELITESSTIRENSKATAENLEKTKKYILFFNLFRELTNQISIATKQQEIENCKNIIKKAKENLKYD
jgi:ankyrin repeat protein